MPGTRIGFAGLGIMGGGMARRFLGAGYPLTVWNRSRDKADALAAEGARVAATPHELAAESDAIVTCVSTPDALDAIAFGDQGLLAGAKAGTLWIETSTIGSVASLKLAGASAEHGVRYLEAPVTGSKLGARDGTLLVMAGGPEDVFRAAEPLLAVFAKKSILVGPHGAGAMMKLIGNTIISFMLEGLSEGAVLGAHAGIPLEKILEVIQASGFASPYWAFKGGAMSRRDFETHFSLDLLHKDQALALAEGRARGVALPGLAAVHEMASKARALGFGSEDISAQIKAVEASSRS
jgi:3-hydroxyisobutyrate dehydrogenase-like beta-hydroxyacid dehydrogenase